MYKVKVNKHKEVTVHFNSSECSAGTIDDKPFNHDILKIKEGSFHVLNNHKSYSIEVVKADYREKNIVLLVNGNKYNLFIKDKFDELLKNLGLDNFNVSKINEIKAPMPGLVIDIIVEEGTVVKKGDTLLVLEAMKMENNIKSPADGTVKKINVKKGVAVDKNQVLINFI